VSFSLTLAKMSDGSTLTASERIISDDAISDGMVPFLSFKTGSFTSVEWRRWANVVTWDVTATLKCVSTEQPEVKSNARQAIDDIMERCALIAGLPVDASGKVVPYGPKTSHLFDQGKLTLLLGRFGPILKSCKVTEIAGSKFSKASIVFGMEFYADLDPRVLKKASVVSIGMTTVDPAQRNVLAGWNDTAPPDSADIRSGGRFSDDVPPPSFASEPGGPSNVPSSIPITLSVKGAAPKDLVRSVNVTPYAATVAIVATRQMLAIATTQDGAAFDVTSRATWLSTAPSKATVSSAGLVTGVATGSTNISATYNGIVSNASAITVP
jgi:hypothetical protein